MCGDNDVLVVIKKLPFDPDQLENRAGAFLEAVRKTITEVQTTQADRTLELTEIGFVPRCGRVELRLYFRTASSLEPVI